MPLHLKFRTLVHKDTGLKNAPKILSKHFRSTLLGIGKLLRASAIRRMRRDTGDEARSLIIRVENQGQRLPSRLTVFSTLVQAFVDAYGMKRGRLVPYRRGTRLYAWAFRKTRGKESKIVNKPKSRRKLSHLSRSLPRARRGKKAVVKRPRVQISNRSRQADKLAFLAARKIFEQGIKPTYWNKKALQANRQSIIRQVKNGLARAANEINRG